MVAAADTKLEIVIKITGRPIRNGVETIVFDAYELGGDCLGSFSGPAATFKEKITKTFDPSLFNVVIR